MININHYLKATDSESFENAIAHKDADGIILYRLACQIQTRNAIIG